MKKENEEQSPRKEASVRPNEQSKSRRSVMSSCNNEDEEDKPSHFIWVLPYLNMQVEWQSSPAVVLGNELNSFVSTPISLL